MKRLHYASLLVAFFILTSVSNNVAQEKLQIDDLEGQWEILDDESSFSFKIKNMVFFNVKGTFSGISGEIDFDKTGEPGFVRLTVMASTINTENDKRDDHLRSEDFFYTSEYPTIEFTGGDVVKTLAPEYTIIGGLTIRSVTNEELVPVELIGYYNGDKNMIEFKGSTKIDRKAYNVDYSGMIIANEATVSYTIVARKK